MNPVIVIPSYWAESDRPVGVGEADVYDHVTPVNKPVPELETCLSSLDKVRGDYCGEFAWMSDATMTKEATR